MLSVNSIVFKYNKKFTLKDINFKANAGDHISIIGESGSGKSTLLKLIYGEFDLIKGTISWNDQPILGPSHNLVIGYPFMKYVSQEFDLMPFTTVAENIGAYLSNFFLDEKTERINELLKVVELTAYANTKVKYLSGGQKQRVALARAIALQPEIILLDEPFSHIDNFKKQSLRRNLFSYLKEKNITCIVATHDKNDVLPFSDKMLALHNGSIIAKGTPKQLYKNPKLPLIASFFGEYNVLESYGIVYAHDIAVTKNSPIKVKVKNSFYNGNHYLVEASLDGKTILFESKNDEKTGSIINLKINKG